MSSSGIQTFNTAFPFDFKIKNQFQGEGLPILYIVNSVDPTADSQKLNIQISATSKNFYSLKGLGFTQPTPTVPTSGSSAAQLVPSNAPISPDPSKYNLAFAIRPGTLRSDVEENFAITLYKGITTSFGTANPNNCIVNGPIARNSDGALLWYVAFENDISLTPPISSWNKVDGGKVMQDFTILKDGSLLGVDANNTIYARSKLEGGTWSQSNLPSWLSSKQAISLAGNSFTDIIPLNNGEYSNLVVTPATGNNIKEIEYASNSEGEVSWQYPSNNGGFQNLGICMMPDQTIAGIGLDYVLYYYTPTDRCKWWPSIDTTNVKQIAAKPDGSLVGIGNTDKHLYAKSGLTTGSWTKIDDSIELSCIAVDNSGAILACDTNGNFYQQTSTQQLLEFELEGISAEAGTGSRSSQLEILFANVSVNKSTNYFSFKRSNNFSIINHEGHSYAPLHFGLIGDSTLLNKKGHQNAFSIFFETIDGKPIALNQSVHDHTKIHFDFPYSDGGKNLMPFGNSSEVSAYQLSDSEAYPFLHSGPFNPISGAAFDAANNEGGSIRFTAEFKNLAKEQKALTTNIEEDVAKNKPLIESKIVPTTGIAEKIYQAQQKSQQLANFITATNGPVQYFLNASNRFMPSIDAVLSWPGGIAYFIMGQHCFKYNRTNNTIFPGYPKLLTEALPGLSFKSIDAAIRKDNTAYLFSGDQCIEFDMTSNTAGNATSIVEKWSGISFNQIDAAINWGNGKLYFFSGLEYAQFDIANNKMDTGYPQLISTGWSELQLNKVTAAINWGNNDAYFFDRNQYVNYSLSTSQPINPNPILFNDLRDILAPLINIQYSYFDIVSLSDYNKLYLYYVGKGLMSFQVDVNTGEISETGQLEDWAHLFPYPSATNPTLTGNQMDAAVTTKNGTYYFFSGPNCFRFGTAGTFGKPINQFWKNVPSDFINIDAAINWGNKCYYLFKGTQYVKCDIKTLTMETGYPKPIQGNWDLPFESITGAFMMQANELPTVAYFFHGNQYACIDYSTKKLYGGYPQSLGSKANFKADAICGAANVNGTIYFFFREAFIKYNTYTKKAESNITTANSVWDCSHFSAVFSDDTGTGGSIYFINNAYENNQPFFFHYGIEAGKMIGYKPWVDNPWNVSFPNIDAAVNLNDGGLYFFYKKQYIRYNLTTRQCDPEQSIQGNIGGLPFDRITAAVNWGNNKVVFFSGDQYVFYNTSTQKVDSAIQVLSSDILNLFNQSDSISSFLNTDEGVIAGETTSSTMPVNLSPTLANPEIAFDQTTWTTLINTKNSNVSFTNPLSDSPTTKLTQWDNLPANYTPVAGTKYTFSESGFLAYVKGNFSHLIQQIKDLNPAAIGTTKATNGQLVAGILPSKTIYEFFKIQFELDQNINAASATELNLSQITNTQQYATYQAIIDAVKNRSNIDTPISSGPDFMIDISIPFSSSNWNAAYEKAVTAFGSEDSLLKKSAIGKNTQDWQEGLTSYLINQLSTIAHQIPNYVYNGSTYLVPSQALYDYLWLLYQESLPKVKVETHQELYTPSSYAFNFSNIQVSGEDGWVTIGIRVENLPGYWDSSFQLSIQKSKTIFAPTLALGRGGPNGRIKLSPADPNYINTQGFNPGSRIDFLSAGENANKQPNVSIEEHYGLNIYGTLPEEGQTGAVGVPTQAGKDTKAGQPVKIKQADLLVEDGRLGIGNVPQGDISGDFTNPNEKLRVVGNVTVEGIIGDQYGPLVPSGTIIQLYSDSVTTYAAMTAPTGWLPCNGTKVGSTTPPNISPSSIGSGHFFYFIKQ